MARRALLSVVACRFLLDMHNLNLTMRKYQTTPLGGIFWRRRRKRRRKNWPVFIKNVSVMKDKERLKKYSRLKEIEKHDLNAICDP